MVRNISQAYNNNVNSYLSTKVKIILWEIHEILICIEQKEIFSLECRTEVSHIYELQTIKRKARYTSFPQEPYKRI
jgi:hypothetical protein